MRVGLLATVLSVLDLVTGINGLSTQLLNSGVIKPKYAAVNDLTEERLSLARNHGKGILFAPAHQWSVS